jgi:hypothetical protein
MMESSDRLLWTRKWTVKFDKRRWISWLAVRPSVFEELCPVAASVVLLHRTNIIFGPQLVLWTLSTKFCVNLCSFGDKRAEILLDFVTMHTFWAVLQITHVTQHISTLCYVVLYLILCCVMLHYDMLFIQVYRWYRWRHRFISNSAPDLCNHNINVRFQVLTAASMMFRAVFWVVPSPQEVVTPWGGHPEAAATGFEATEAIWAP